MTPAEHADLPTIDDLITCSPECPTCQGDGLVCEDHPDQPWLDRHDCGAPGMPCPSIAAARATLGGTP